MKDVFFIDDQIISPLGFSTEENLQAIERGISGVKKQMNTALQDLPFCGALLDDLKIELEFEKITNVATFTKLERIFILAISKLLKRHRTLDLNKTALVISSTKGNINLLQQPNNFNEERVKLYKLGNIIQAFFNFKYPPIVLSNACISGGLAIATAKKMLQQEHIKNVIVVGGDIVSTFTLAGFGSFQALDPEPCKPFSKYRNGINLGEAAAALLLSNSPDASVSIKIRGEASVNDANHISGPSRNGEGLYRSIQKTLQEASIISQEIDFISAHGTATIYNDEMEAIAFNRANLQNVDLHSLKAFYGHTLGASALIESIICAHSLKNDKLYRSLGFDEIGVSKNIAVLKKNKEKKMRYALKTASGFGGCNFAMILEKTIL